MVVKSARRVKPLWILGLLIPCCMMYAFYHLTRMQSQEPVTWDLPTAAERRDRRYHVFSRNQTQRQIGPGKTSFLDRAFCGVQCRSAFPCEYLDEVDLRIIVITYDRPGSLAKCLESIRNLDTMGDRVSVDVWVDRSEQGTVDNATLTVVNKFRTVWKGGRTCLHVQDTHAYIGRQWRNTWRPRENTKEIGLILEDDVDISRHAYRYLHHVTREYDHRNDVSGYTLQMHDVNFFGVNHYRPMSGDVDKSVFLYGVLGTWGFAPRPQAWRAFQDWFSTKPDALKPLVPGIVPTRWYEGMLPLHTEQSMWEMWHIYHSNISALYCVYSNLVKFSGRQDVLLAVNRKEKGLHFSKKGSSNLSPFLLSTWNESFVSFPTNIVKYNYDGVPE